MQFVYLRTCVPLYLVCGSNFLQLGSTVCRNAQKRVNADREKNKWRKTALQRCNPNFLMLLCLTKLQRVGVIPILKKNFNPFALFPFIDTPSKMIK